MKFCRECATGNQGENCPTACKGDQQSCACLNDGCCKPGIFSFALVWDIHGPDMVGPMPEPVPTQSQPYADFQPSRKPFRRLFFSFPSNFGTDQESDQDNSIRVSVPLSPKPPLWITTVTNKYFSLWTMCRLLNRLQLCWWRMFLR